MTISQKNSGNIKKVIIIYKKILFELINWKLKFIFIKELIAKKKRYNLMVFMENLYQKICRNTFWIAVILVFAIIAYCSPLCSDDYEFYSYHFRNVLDILDYALYYGNGRLLGNVIVHILLGSPFLCVLVKAFTITGIIYLMPRVLKINNKVVDILTFIFVLCMPSKMFAEIYVWTSGFSNFMPSILITLYIIYKIQAENNKSTCTTGICLVLGFLGQLFAEHNTVINILVAASLLLYFGYGKDVVRKRYTLYWLLGDVFGGIVMFIIPKIFFIENNRTGQYRSLNIGDLQEVVSGCLNNLFHIFRFLNEWSILLLMIVIIGSLLLRRYKEKYTAKNFLLMRMVYNIIFSYISFDIVYGEEWVGKFAGIKEIISAIIIICLVVIFLVTVFCCNLGEKWLIMPLILGVLMSTAPFIFINPISRRCLFLSYCLGVMALLASGKFIVVKFSSVENKIYRNLLIMCSVVMVCMSSLFINIKWLDQIRNTYIIQQMEQKATEIETFAIPYNYVYWDGTWSLKRYYYYEEWEDITFLEIDCNLWLQKYIDKIL